MKRILPLLFMIGIFSACQDNQKADESEHSTKNVSPATVSSKTAPSLVHQDIEASEFKKRIESKAGIVLDVRTQGEVAQGKIPNAKHIDIMQAGFEQEVKKLNTEQPVYVYCAVGGRSSNAMQKMKEIGFKEVYNLKGGINAWKKAGYTVE